MKRFKVLLLLLLLPLLMSACIVIHVPGDAPASSPAATVSGLPTEPLETPANATSEPSLTPASASPSATAAVTTAPNSGPALYTSYAHMTAYHPASGVAEFDYFDMLLGEDAVKWMVEKEGYSQAEAEAIVADFADSEYIEKNENPQVRSIDLNYVELKLMYDASGDEMLPNGPAASSVAILNELYAHHPDLVTDIFFYYIEVENGEAVSVTQVYWP